MKTILLLIIFLLFCVSTLFADIAPNPLHQGLNPKTKAPTKIQMVSEEVKILLKSKDECQFLAEFRMQNQSDKAESLEVGFPSSYEAEVRELVVFVDGIEVKIKNDHESYEYKMGPPGRQYSKTNNTYWLLWDMSFKPKQTIIVQLSYWVKPRDNDHWLSPYKDYLSYIQGEAKFPADIASKFKNITTYQTGYILRTGKEWYGNIGEAIIKIYSPTHGAKAVRSIYPGKNIKVENDGKRTEVIMDICNFEPEEDIEIEFNPDVPIDEECKNLEKLIKDFPDDKCIKEFYDSIIIFKPIILHFSYNI